MNDFLQIRMLQVLPFGKDSGWTLLLIPLLPLAGFLLLGLFGRKHIKNSSGIIGTSFYWGQLFYHSILHTVIFLSMEKWMVFIKN